MNQHQHHEQLINGLAEQLKPILEESKQGVYIYLDDVHKICNEKFAQLLGYNSPDEWAKVEKPFPEIFVDNEKSF